MINGEIRGDAPRPRAKGSLRIESRTRFVNSPERFHGQILRRGRIANNAKNPAVYVALELLKQRLEGIDVSLRETLEQLHFPFSIRSYWFGGPQITSFFARDAPGGCFTGTTLCFD
jgi:hypothetical protein